MSPDQTAHYLLLTVTVLRSYWTDFVLVWEEPLNSQKEEDAGVSSAHRQRREKFLNNLRRSGLLHEQVSKTNTPESGPSIKPCGTP